MSGNLLNNHGCSLQIITINDGKFHLNEINLKSILNHENCKNKPVFIIDL
jgi:hypothetical protein